MPTFGRFISRLLCIPVPPRPPPKTGPYPNISHPYNVHTGYLSSYRRAAPPRRRPTLARRCSTVSFTCAGVASSSQHTFIEDAEQEEVTEALFSRRDSGFGNWLPIQGSMVLCRECELFPEEIGDLCRHCERARKSRPVSEAWTISAYGRDSFCLTRGPDQEQEQDSPTLPYERFFTIDSQPPPPPTPPLQVTKRARKREEDEVGSIDFNSSYYGRLYRDWISV